MKTLLIAALLLVAAVGFAQPTGSVTSESKFDADAETLKQDFSAKVTLGALALGAGLIISDIGTNDPTADVKGDIAYTFAEKLKVKLESSYGVDSVDKVPVTITVEWPLWQLAFTVKYVNDNINAGGEDGTGEVETGAVTLKAVLSF